MEKGQERLGDREPSGSNRINTTGAAFVSAPNARIVAQRLVRTRLCHAGISLLDVGRRASQGVDFDFNVGLDTIPSVCSVSIGTGIQAQSQLKPKIWCGRAKPASGSIRPRTCLSSRSLTRSCAGKCFGVPLQVWGTSRMRMMHSSRRRSRGQPVPIETEETSPQSRLKPKMSRDSLSATH